MAYKYPDTPSSPLNINHYPNFKRRAICTMYHVHEFAEEDRGREQRRFASSSV